jgi:hypothetical protein
MNRTIYSENRALNTFSDPRLANPNVAQKGLKGNNLINFIPNAGKKKKEKKREENK